MLVAIFVIVTLVQGCSSWDSLESRYAESRYAAEAIPVIACLRTKILLYQYDNGILPCIATNEVLNGKDVGKVAVPQIETWVSVDSETATTVSVNPSKEHIYKMASCSFSSGEPPLKGLTVLDHAKGQEPKCGHWGATFDIDPVDLMGMYSRPSQYQFLVMRNGTSDYAYFIGCFGDGKGLSAGTGYAVCEITSLSAKSKYVGIWRRYCCATGDAQICFTSNRGCNEGHCLGCYVPDKSAFDNMMDKDALLKMVDTMKKTGLGI